MARRRSHHRRSHSGLGAMRTAFKSAAKACKGKKIGAFRACMRSHLKK